MATHFTTTYGPPSVVVTDYKVRGAPHMKKTLRLSPSAFNVARLGQNTNRPGWKSQLEIFFCNALFLGVLCFKSGNALSQKKRIACDY